MIVVDASVAVKWLVPELGADAAAMIFGQPLSAPHLLFVEVTNALWAKLRRGTLARDEAEVAAAKVRTMPVEAVSDAGLAPAAFALAVRLNHAAYDCFYLALAIERDTHVVTADRRFVAAADAHAETKGRVRLLGAATPPAA